MRLNGFLQCLSDPLVKLPTARWNLSLVSYPLQPVPCNLLHHLRFNPVVNPVRVPPFDGIHGNSIE
jgi:hypothetical protein